jgi:N6-adenosine-specific RNA methylase IME4
MTAPSMKTINVGLGGIAVNPERLRALRKDKVTELAESMRASGLLQPVVLRTDKGSDYVLVVGRHRFEAAKLLKWDSVPAIVHEGMKADAAELAEIDENLIRAELSPIERFKHVARRKVLYLADHPRTKHGGAPGKAGGGKKTKDAKIASFVDDTAAKTGKARRTVALDAKRGAIDGIEDAIGTSLDKGDEVDALIKLPADARDALIKRARDGEKVSAKAEAKKVKREQRERDLGAKIVELPQKKYGVIVADPEWRFEPWSRETGMDRSADNHYPTSVLDVIKSRDVPSIAANDCILFLWATIPMLPHALAVMEAWGFNYKSNHVWGKDREGTGYWNREKHEHLLIGTRGNPVCPAPGTQRDSLIMSPRLAHSEKPECFLEMIETYFPNTPKIELNARRARKNWARWGLEAPTTEEAAE